MRIPDGYISAHANHARIMNFPLEDGLRSISSKNLDKISEPEVEVVYAHDVISFARDRGYFEGSDKDFSFSDVYAPLNFGALRFCELRVWSMFNQVNSEMDQYWDYATGNNRENRMPLFIKPDRKLSPQDLMAFKRDYLQGTELDMSQDIGAAPYGLPYRWRPLTPFEDIIANTNDIVIVTEAAALDEPGPRIVYVNAAFTRLTGYTAEEVLGKSPRLLQGPETDGDTRRAIRTALQAGEAFRGEILNFAKSGQRYWLDLQIVPLRDARQRITHFAAIERDLSERYQAETALREERNRTHAIVAAMAEGVVVQDRSGRITSCNEAAASMLGLECEELAGHSTVEPRGALLREDGTPFLWADHPALHTLRSGQACQNVMMGISRPHDMTRWISMNTNPIFLSDDAQPDAVVTTFRDISALRLADQMKTEFISTVSHELRTPLTSIKGALGLFNGGALGEVTEQARQMLDIASRNVDRLSLLINDLLDMEKIASGNITLEMTRLRLNSLIEDAVYANAPYARAHQVRFCYTPPAQDIEIEADAHRLLQVLTNFLSNAAKFSPAGSDIPITITITGDQLRVTVCDNGPGIPPEYHARIFERFSQHDASDRRQHGGTGLGLAISRALVELHHGDIGFYANEPSGSCFYFALPYPSEGHAL
ncbi:MAG: ATP-binding protein [Gammaproteobacteria bacterium]